MKLNLFFLIIVLIVAILFSSVFLVGTVNSNVHIKLENLVFDETRGGKNFLVQNCAGIEETPSKGQKCCYGLELKEYPNPVAGGTFKVCKRPIPASRPSPVSSPNPLR